MRINLFRSVVCDEAIKNVEEVLRSGWLHMGPKTKAFEEAFAQYTGSQYCIGLNSGTASLHMGLHLLNLPTGSEVVTTPLTFVATNHIILYEGLKPVFADIQPETGNLDVNAVKERLTEQTKAIMIMHYGGYPCDIDEFYAFSRSYGIPIIEDCAHACGAIYKGKHIGSHGDIHAFSFHAVKNLTTGDGGALTVRSEEYYKRLRRLRWLGIDKDTFQREGKTYSWEYDVPEVGFKCHMNDIQAAIGLAQLKKLDEYNRRRNEIADMYREKLHNVPGIKFLNYKSDRKSSYHLFCILAENRNTLVDKLRSSGVDVSVHYKRNDLYNMYEKYNLPNTEYFWSSVISLPMHVLLTEDDIDYVTDTIRKGW